MPNFQGSGFSIGLPEGCADASVYTFLLPTPPDAQLTPYLTIKFERLQEAPDLKAYVSKQHAALQENAEGFQVVDYAAGQHDGYDVVLTTLEWGPEEGRVRQRQAYCLLPGEKTNKIYCLTGPDLSSHFNESQPLFDQAFRSFKPNDIQVIEA